MGVGARRQRRAPGLDGTVRSADSHTCARRLDTLDWAPLVDPDALSLRLVPQPVHELDRIQNPAAGHPHGTEVER